MHTGTLINDLLDQAQIAGTKAAKEPRIPVCFSVSPALYDRLTTTAKECGANVSQFCRVGMASYIDGLEEESEMERARR